MNRDDDRESPPPSDGESVGRTPPEYENIGVIPMWIMQIGQHVPEHERTRSAPPKHSVSALIATLKTGEAPVKREVRPDGYDWFPPTDSVEPDLIIESNDD